MKKKVAPNKDSLFYASLVLLSSISVLLFVYFIMSGRRSASEVYEASENRLYHVLVLGRNDNELFLQEMFKGAEKLSEQYHALVELYVPHSQAENESMQELFDYATFVNADGVIAYMDSLDEEYDLPHRPDGTPIPLITTGQYNPALPQVSFIGIGYWELGRKIADETLSFLKDMGRVCLINGDTNNNPYYSNLTNAIQTRLFPHNEVSYEVVTKYTIENLKELARLPDDEKFVFICLSEQETIQLAQSFQDFGLEKKNNINLIGFGANEVCLHYLNIGVISELISVDPEKIGETSITELFEYRNRGYANSYAAAEVQILRSPK